MNILFVLHYPEMYGSIRSILDLAYGLQQFDVQPHFVIPDKGSTTDYLDNNHLPYKILSLPFWVDERKFSLPKQLKRIDELQSSIKTVLRTIKEWKIDLVYTNTSVTPIGRLAAFLEGLPHIWHIREFGDLDFGFRPIYPRWLINWIITSSAAVICHANSVRKYHFPYNRKNIHLVYNGCATREQFDKLLDTRRSIPTHPVFTFAMLSGLSPRKGQAQAIRVLAALNSKGLQARLVLAGGGRQDFTDSLKTLAVDLGVKDLVEFIGLVSDPYPVYFSADCVLICSEHEAFSRAGLEAMSTALPLIARNSGGSPELMENGKTGILYDAEDELVSAMTRMIQYPTEARQMGLAGWNRAREHFNIEDYAANVYQIIQSVAGKEQ